ncbi:MAG: hypothetical protein VXW22_16660, partial [Pseudomonadota bacterium]|nr:hypothetical protein [Pseudomonadota bacterium]
NATALACELATLRASSADEAAHLSSQLDELTTQIEELEAASAADQDSFRFFGPTCDSIDAMAGPFHLPTDTREGDWIEICHLGAYGQALASNFNGFQSETTVAVLG